jgi:hypothetical protein
LAKHTKATTIDIASPADVRTIADVHRELLQALQRNGAVQLRVDADADIDLTFVQLVESARRFAAAEGKAVTMSAPAAAGLRDILQRGGFLTAVVDRTFWLHQAGEF